MRNIPSDLAHELMALRDASADIARRIESLLARMDDTVDEPVETTTAPVELPPATKTLRHFISLNDSYRFAREIFENDAEKMDAVLQQISEMDNVEHALMMLRSETDIHDDSDALADLTAIIKDYFKQYGR